MSFYSKNSGDFDSLDSWSNSSYSGAAAVRLPGAVKNDVLIIGDNKTINLTSSISNLGTVRVDSSGTLNPYSYVISGSGLFDLRKGGTLKITSPNGIDSASGSIQTATQLYDASANFEFSGTSPQVSGTEFPSSASNLTINNTSGVTLSNDTRINNELALTQGNLILGDKNLTLGSNASVSGTFSSSNMVVADGNGELRKEFSSVGSFTFPVGDTTGNADYSPVTLNFTNGTFSNAYASVKVVNTKHPQDSSVFHFINRYWTVNSNGITDFSCDVTCNYTDQDIQPGADETKIYARQFNSSQWTLLNPVNASMNELSGTVSSFSDFTGGESEATTGIKITSDNTPTSFAVYQNYPNPFNPSTKIRYAIPSVSSNESRRFVTIKVFDILGTEVLTLVNEEQSSGIYEVEFNGSNLSSGVYIYKIQVYPANGGAGNFSETKKMQLTK